VLSGMPRNFARKSLDRAWQVLNSDFFFFWNGETKTLPHSLIKEFTRK
jgi:hypothetical protein